MDRVIYKIIANVWKSMDKHTMILKRGEVNDRQRITERV